MTLSIWRLSHLVLAIAASGFILIASVTGAILAFEPISNQLKSFSVSNANAISISETITVLQDNYGEVVSVSVDDNGFVKASVIHKNESASFYINPLTAEKLGDVINKSPLFEFATNLHRSLFLKSTGRFLIGLASLLLCLIAITGVKLIAKRQGGYKRWFSKVVNENFAQYYHVVLGRYFLIPILIITITGMFLSLKRFNLLPDANGTHQLVESKTATDNVPFSEFEIFKNSSLDQLKSLEFPFSEDEEDYFVLKLNSGDYFIHQYSGQNISKAEASFTSYLLDWSIVLHTGRGTIIWSIVLLLACVALLFFMYSGFAMSIKRRKEKGVFKNSYSKDNAEYVLLVGSETGSTFRFAKQFAEALLDAKQSVFVDILDNYTTYKNIKHLIVFTSTYGEGDAPSSAKNFEKLIDVTNQLHTINYSVVGFGSLMYPEFCKYAIVVDALLQKHKNFIPNQPLFKVNNQSSEAFKSWAKQWSESTSVDLKLKPQKPKVNRKRLKNFEVITNTEPNVDDTFLLQLRPQYINKFQSGDLLAFYPKEDNIERLYSIGRVDDNILLSVKRHEFGVCSRQLSELSKKAMTKAKIIRNLDFHFPTYAKEVVMISNGTGIGPFLGMINQYPNTIKRHLFWGGRTQESLEIYSKFIDDAFSKKNLSSLHVAYSQEHEEKVYVQDILLDHADWLAELLKNGGVVMICGAISMQNKVLEVLNAITTERLKQPLSTFENNEQIKMDCY